MKHVQRDFVLLAILTVAAAANASTITRSNPPPRPPPDPPIVVAPMVPEPAETGDAFPSSLQGELIVFDLRRLDLYRARPDGTQLRRIDVSMGDAESRALNAAGIGAAGAGGAFAATGAVLATGSGFLAPAVGAYVATVGGVIALPVIGITQMVKVLKRHGRVVRSITQIQPTAAVAPSGDALLLCSNIEGKLDASNMRLIDLTGRERTNSRVDRRYGVGGVAPDISANGRHALFVAPPGKKMPSEIYRIDLSTGRPEQLTRDGAGKTFPRWSPDGTSIAFQQVVVSSPDDVTIQIFVMPSTGGQPVQVTHDELAAVTPSWSPDGTTIVYGSLNDGAVHSIHPDGSADVALTAGGAMKLHPQLSPGGSYVMYLESSVAASGLEPPEGEKPGRKEKPTIGEDFRLRLVRLSDRHEWNVPLSEGQGRPHEIVEKTNLFWFQWCRT